MIESYNTNELENAIDYLEQTAVFYNNKEKNHRFKWVCISLHGALYGFAVSNLRGTDYNRVLVKGDKHFQDRNLLGIGIILKLCKQEDMLTNENGKVLVLNKYQDAAIVRLTDFRNYFSHFKPSVYGITIPIEEIVKPVLEVIYFLAIESKNVLYHSRSQRERVQQAFDAFELDMPSE